MLWARRPVLFVLRPDGDGPVGSGGRRVGRGGPNSAW
jgi:hypothetical protein